ncbi:MAG: hypothetical protein OSB46_06905 [Alphaproteobacteria bacterium]|nr:hypothetical protein [Alphaproteobacteria bacterium]
MRNSYEIQSALFVSSIVLGHPSLHDPDDTEAVLDWTRLVALMDEIYASTAVRPNYPLLTLLLSLLRASGTSFLTNALRPSLARDLLFRRFFRLELSKVFLTQRHWAIFANNSYSTICGRRCWER